MELPYRAKTLLNDERFVVLMLFIIALLMRLFGISYQSIGLDEGSTFFYSQYTWDQFVDAHEPNSPIYYIMEGYVIGILGQTEFGLRFTSAIAGALAVPLTYYLAKRLLNVRAVSIIAALLIMVSPSCLYYSQEARAYSIVLLLFLCQTHLILTALEKNSIVCWILFILVSVMSFFMQFIGMIGTFTLYCYVLFYYKDEIKNRNYKVLGFIAITVIAFFIMSVPVMNYAIEAYILRSGAHSEWCFIGPVYLADFVYKMFFRSVIFGILMTVFLMIGSKVCLDQDKRAAGFLLICTLVPITVTYFLSFVNSVTPRYIFWSLPAFYILMACSVLKGGRDPEVMKVYVNRAAVIMLVACMVCLPYYYIHVCKEDFRGGTECLEEYVQPGDAVVYVPDGWNSVRPCIFFYTDTQNEGVTYLGADTEEQIISVINNPAYANVYILVYDSQEPYDWICSLCEDNKCQQLYHAYWMDVYRYTGERPISLT